MIRIETFEDLSLSESKFIIKMKTQNTKIETEEELSTSESKIHIRHYSKIEDGRRKEMLRLVSLINIKLIKS